jgi:hypothetical protein
MNTERNVTIFIKRAEDYQTKEFIINVFHKHNIGKVKDVEFIKKQNNTGKSYNGVIVIFEKLNNITIFNEMNASRDGSIQFYFNNSQYWFITTPNKNVLPKCQEIITIDASLSDKERIKQLEDLVKSMSSQINYMQTKQEQSERNMMEYEHKDTQHHLYNIELQAKLDDKDIEQTWIEADFKEDIDILKTENEALRSHLKRKYYECEQLREELKEQTCMLSYAENQVVSMKHILNDVSLNVNDELPIKQVIDAYIKEYC